MEAGTSDEHRFELLTAGLRGALLFGNGFIFLRGRVPLLDIERGKAANDPADFFFAAREAARNPFERNGWTGLPGHIVETAEANAAHRVDLSLDGHLINVFLHRRMKLSVDAKHTLTEENLFMRARRAGSWQFA